MPLARVLAVRAKEPTRSRDLLQRLHHPLPSSFCSVEVASETLGTSGGGKCGGGGCRGWEIGYNLKIREGTKTRRAVKNPRVLASV